MPSSQLELLLFTLLLIGSVVEASEDQSSSSDTATVGGARGRNRLNKHDFKAKGGARKALGNATLEKLAKRAGFHGPIDKLVEALDNDDDLVSCCCIPACAMRWKNWFQSTKALQTC